MGKAEDYYVNTWIFTFGANTPNGGKCVRLHGSYSEARSKMFHIFGDRWAFQYADYEWTRHQNLHSHLLETEITLEEAIDNDRKRVSEAGC